MFAAGDCRPLRCHTFAGREGIRIPFAPVGSFRHVAGGYRGIPIRLMPVVFLFPVTLPERMFVSGPGRIFRPECGMKRQEDVAGFCRFPGNRSAGFADFLSCFPRGGFRPFLAGPFANGRLTAGNGFFAVGYRHAGRFFTAGCRQPEAVLLNGRFVGLFPDIFRFLRGDFICMVLDCFSGKGSRSDGRR